ncbi:MAG: SufS family cysteine desulfurase [Firmicutes bacterium]|nr:SufS family cysteine desulfurase [Bacillota bacterium]
MYDLKKIRSDFPMLNGKVMQGHPLVYLDNAATTFKPKVVLNAIEAYYNDYTANAHRGDYDLTHTVDVKFDEARETVADFIHAEKEEIVFTSGTSMSLNMVAYGYGAKYLKKGDEILLTQAEHASNVLPWFKVAEMTGAKIGYIPLDKEGRLTVESLKKTITAKTKVVAVAHVTNVLGFTVDIKALAKVVHEFGAIIVVDGAQSVPHLKTDVKDLDCDFLAFSGHKMCGPTGIGVLYGKYALLQKTDPFMTGGGMNARFDMCGEVSYLQPPFKFEAGTQNIEGVLGLAAAIKYLQGIGLDAVAAHEHELRAYAISEMKKLDNVILYNEKAEAGIITFNLKGVFGQDAATYFNSRGVAVRSGNHCAKILLTFLNTSNTLRASLYLYTSKEDVDALIEACKKGGDFLDAYFN